MNKRKLISFSMSLVLIAMLALILSACGGQTTGKPTSPSTLPKTIQGTVWVADEYGNSLTVMDATTNNVVTTLTGIEGPHNLQVAPDGKSVWAVSGHEALAVMIDAATYKVHGTVMTGNEPAHIILTPDGQTAYATNGDDNTVTAIDVATMKAYSRRSIPARSAPQPRREVGVCCQREGYDPQRH